MHLISLVVINAIALITFIFGFNTTAIGQLKIHNNGFCSVNSLNTPLKPLQVNGDALFSSLSGNISPNQFSPLIRSGNGQYTNHLNPDFSWLNDFGTGISHPADWQLGFNSGFVERMRISWQGNVGIGYTAPQYKLDVNGQVRAFNISITSDRSFKTNLSKLQNTNLSLQEIQAYSFKYKDFDSTRIQYGFIAQEIEKVLPDLVYSDSLGVKSVNYIGLIPLLVESHNFLLNEVNQLKEMVRLINESHQNVKSNLTNSKTVLLGNNILEFSNNAFLEGTMCSVRITDMNGKIVISQEVAYNNLIRINIDKLSSGIYILSVYQNPETMCTEKLIIR